MANLGTFDQFARLPNELKSQIYRYVPEPRRVLQVYFNDKSLSWVVCKDTLKPDPISQVHQLSRKSYTLFLDVAILPERDIILISDPKFTLRPIQWAFLSAANLQQLQHLAFTVDVWQGLRHTNHEFPRATLSAAALLRKLTNLKDFYLTICDDDNAEFETDYYDYGDESDDDEADNLEEGMRDMAEEDIIPLEEALLDHIRTDEQSPSTLFLNDVETLPPLERDSNGILTQAGKADKFLRIIEEQTLEEMIWKPAGRIGGILRLCVLKYDSTVRDLAFFFMNEVQMVFDKEKSANEDWKQPEIHIRELECGEMPLQDEVDDDELELMDLGDPFDEDDEGIDEDEEDFSFVD